MADNSTDEPVYRIGTVARLTGIPAVTLRMWERRYSVVAPDRTPGRNRLYTRDDIGRLALIKRLVDNGNAISTVATLSLDQLQERLQLHRTPTTAVKNRLVVVGTALPVKLDQANGELPGLEVVATFQDSRSLALEGPALKPQVLVLEYPVVDDAAAAEIQHFSSQLMVQRTVVVYGFGRSEVMRRLNGGRITTLRAPAGLAELRRACLPEGEPPRAPPQPLEPETPPDEDWVPPRRYANDALARLTALPTSIHCECPQHLAELLFSLTSFEIYCQECRQRYPDDAVLHAYLHVTTARARAMMENALEKVMEAEGLRE
ncbi:MAG: MerR family transcriptional regulator [Candidatus Competibacterales bacterium]